MCTIYRRRRSRCEVCSTAAGVEVLGWCQSCSQAVQNPSSVSVPRVPMSWAISLHAPNHSLPLSVPLSELYSHLITFQQRHAALFIAEWCFFIRLCLFVVHWSTEGFLPADVSSAGLQRDCWNVGEERKKRQTERNWMIQKGDRVERCATKG